jgi:predicted RNA methylase
LNKSKAESIYLVKMSDDEDDKPKRVMKTTEVKINDGLDVIQKRAKDVDAFLGKSNSKDAILAAIADPPLGSKNEQAKDLNFKTVLKALASAKEADVPKYLEEVHKTHGGNGVDNVMKYVCRGLAEAEACAILLKWHGAIVEREGLGPIVRVMTDRRGV